MIQVWLLPQLKEDFNNSVFQQDGAPPHWDAKVQSYLNEELPWRWIRRCADDLVHFQWPLDQMVSDFFLSGYVKDCVYIPPQPAASVEPQEHIKRAFIAISREMLTCV